MRPIAVSKTGEFDMKPTTIYLAIAIGIGAFAVAAEDAPTAAKTPKEGSVTNTTQTTVMTTVRVRYMVNDLDPAVTFYTKYLGFRVKQQASPNFAMLSRGTLELVLSTPRDQCRMGVSPSQAAGTES